MKSISGWWRRRAGTVELLEARCLLTVFDVSTVSELSDAFRSAEDGDEVVLAPGTYTGSFYVKNLSGVRIRSLDPNNRAVIDASGRTNGFQFVDPRQLEIDGLVIENANVNGINIDDGGDFSTPAEDVVLKNLLVRNIGSSGNHDAIKLSGVVGFHLDRIQAINWGEGGSAVDMVGSHHGLIENSYFENDVLATGSGVRPKGGSTHITIRANRFVNAGGRPVQAGGSTGLQYFRPQPPGSVEANHIVAEGNVIIGSNTAVAYVNINGGGQYHHNLIYRPQRWVTRILKENDNPGFVDTQGGSFHDNIIVWNSGDLSTTVNIGPDTIPGSFDFRANQWFNQTHPADSVPSLPVAEVGGVHGVDPGVSSDEAITWEFPWGKWLVNATDSSQSITLADWQSQRLRRGVDESAAFDPRRSNPFSGNWSEENLQSGELVLAPFSQMILTPATASPPSVLAVAINATQSDPADLPRGPQPTNWGQQRSMLRALTVSFSQAVLLDESDLRLWNLGVSAPVDTDVEIPVHSQMVSLTGNQLTLQFAPAELTDGVYQLEILPSATNTAGQPLDGDGDGVGGDSFRLLGSPNNRFYRLAGDWNGDQGVSVFDFSTFSYWFGLPADTAPEYVDLNGDGGVSVFDFSAFSTNFGVGVRYPNAASWSTAEHFRLRNSSPEPAPTNRAAGTIAGKLQPLTSESPGLPDWPRRLPRHRRVDDNDGGLLRHVTPPPPDESDADGLLGDPGIMADW